MSDKEYSSEYIKKIVAMLVKHEKEMKHMSITKQEGARMKNNLIPVLKDFMIKEKIDLSISEDNSSEFWLDDNLGGITVRFKLNVPKHEILYDVYSPELSVHLKEETLKDTENLEFLAEETKRWKIAKIIEDIWLVLDQIEIWTKQNNFNLMEKQLI